MRRRRGLEETVRVIIDEAPSRASGERDMTQHTSESAYWPNKGCRLDVGRSNGSEGPRPARGAQGASRRR